MNFILTVFTILSMPICTIDQQVVFENQEVVKPTTPKKTGKIKFKKVPTKWVKITKKSN